jgi:hypothetical protein
MMMVSCCCHQSYGQHLLLLLQLPALSPSQQQPAQLAAHRLLPTRHLLLHSCRQKDLPLLLHPADQALLPPLLLLLLNLLVLSRQHQCY